MPSHFTYPQATHTWVRHIQEKDEEEIEEDMALAEVDSSDHSTDIDLDSEKNRQWPFSLQGRIIRRDG